MSIEEYLARQMPLANVRDVSSIPDAELLRRAVLNARDKSKRRGVMHPRWIAVMDTFLLGSTFSAQLVRRFGLDPDEMVKR